MANPLRSGDVVARPNILCDVDDSRRARRLAVNVDPELLHAPGDLLPQGMHLGDDLIAREHPLEELRLRGALESRQGIRSAAWPPGERIARPLRQPANAEDDEEQPAKRVDAAHVRSFMRPQTAHIRTRQKIA